MVVADGRLVRIDEQAYLLSRQGEGVAFVTAEVPSQSGDPLSERRVVMEDWSRGIGDGRGFVEGGTSYMTGMWAPPGRLTIGHDVDTRSLSPSQSANFDAMVVAGGWLWVAFGARVHRVNLTNASHTYATLPGTVTALIEWRGALFAAVDGSPYQINPAANVTAGTHDWAANSASETADALGLSKTSSTGVSPVRGRGNKWSRMVAPTDETAVDGTWGAETEIGAESAEILDVFSHNRWDFVLKTDGLYTFTEETSEAATILGDLRQAESPYNAYGLWHNHLLICSKVGLYRIVLGASQRTAGIEECELDVLGYQDSLGVAAFGKFLYELRRIAYTRIVLIQYRVSRSGDTGLGSPFTPIGILDEFSFSPTMQTAITISGSTLYYGGNNLRWLRLQPDGSPRDVTAAAGFSANTYDSIVDPKPTVALSPTDFGTPDTVKYLRRLELVCEPGSTGSIKVEVAGQTVERAIQERTVVPFPKGTRGTRFKPLIKFDSGNVEVLSMTWYFTERPLMKYSAQMVLTLSAEAVSPDTGSRSAKQMRADLEALTDGGAVTLVDPDGGSHYGFLGALRAEDVWQWGDEPPVGDIALTFVEAEYLAGESGAVTPDTDYLAVNTKDEWLLANDTDEWLRP